LISGELTGQNVCVWFRFNNEIKLLSEYLTKKKIKHKILTGEIPPRERGEIIGDFGKTFKVILGQAKVVNVGLDFSVASVAINYSRCWDGLLNQQLDSRLDSVTRNDPSLHIDIVARNTVDEDLLEALKDKKVGSASVALSVHYNTRRRLGL
jgi:SNF2 family DNA or RNA helicase